MKSIVKIYIALSVMLTFAGMCAKAQQPAATPTEAVSGYVIGPDDEIMIRGIDGSDATDKPGTQALIGTNGDVTLPLIGRVKAGGLTVEQLETELNTQ